MARSTLLSRLLPVGIVGGVGYLAYEAALHGTLGGPGSEAQKLALSIHQAFGGLSVGGVPGDTGTGGGTGAGPSTQGATTAAGACAILPYGDLGSISRDAQQHGIVSATDTRAIIYGRTWWAINHGGNACSFNQASQADQIVWQSVAINGH